MSNLNSKTVKELKNLAAQYSVSKSGTKAELVSRIEAKMDAQAAADADEYKGRMEVLKNVGESNPGDIFSQINGVIELGLGATATFTYKTSAAVRKVLPLCSYQIVNEETGEVYSYLVARDLGIKKATDDGLRTFNMDLVSNFMWTGKFVPAVPQYLYPTENEHASKKPVPVYRIQSERGRNAEIAAKTKQGYSTTPTIGLSRPMFVAKAATPQEEPPQASTGYSW